MSIHQDGEKTCQCHPDTFLISKKTTSLAVSASLIILFFVFVVGYFWGHQIATQEFSSTVEQQSFADQIHYSLSCNIDDDIYEYAYNDYEESEVQDETSLIETSSIVFTNISEKKQEKYSAHLAGFQSKEKANQCMQTIVSKGLPVRVAQRSSKTKKGKIYNWYQVVTQAYENKNDLLDHIATIRQIVKLHDIQIVSIPVKNDKKI